MINHTRSISGLYKKNLGGFVNDFQGELFESVNAVNSAFLVHPQDKSDIKFFEPSIIEYEKFMNFVNREDEKWKKETSIALAENRKPNYHRKPRLVQRLYNSLGVRIIGDYYMHTNTKISHGALISIPHLTEEYIEAISGNKELYNKIYKSIVEALRIAKNIGAKFVGLGAYNSILTQTIRGNRLDQENILPVTSGNDLTAAGIPEGIIIACNKAGINIKDLDIAIVGATGSVGNPSTKLISEHNPKSITLTARIVTKLRKLQSEIIELGYKKVQISTNIEKSIRNSDIIIFTVSSTKSELELEPEIFENVKIICDVSQPSIITKDIINKYPRKIFLKGSIFEVPGEITGHEFLRMGEKNQAYGCLAATIARSLFNIKISVGNGILIDHRSAQDFLKQSKKIGIKPIEIRL